MNDCLHQYEGNTYPLIHWFAFHDDYIAVWKLNCLILKYKISVIGIAVNDSRCTHIINLTFTVQ